MLKRFGAVLVTASMTLTAIAPLSQATAAGSVSFDEDSDILLQLLAIDADSTDSLYQDPEFIEAVNAFSQLNNDIDATGENIINILDSIVLLADEMQDIDDPRFAEYKMTVQEAQEAMAVIDEIKAELTKDGKGLSDLLWEEALAYESYDYSFDNQSSGIDAYGYADVSYAVPGQVVNLYDYTNFNDYASLSSVVWSQSAGPATQLMTSESGWQNDKSFVMPSFNGSSLNYVQFDLIASQNGKTDTHTVKVYLDTTGETVISNFYWDLLGRQADPAGLAYWVGEYQKGTSIEDIRQAFMNSPEYQNRI